MRISSKMVKSSTLSMMLRFHTLNRIRMRTRHPSRPVCCCSAYAPILFDGALDLLLSLRGTDQSLKFGSGAAHLQCRHDVLFGYFYDFMTLPLTHADQREHEQRVSAVWRNYKAYQHEQALFSSCLISVKVAQPNHQFEVSSFTA